jgi:hypothetical protein
MNVRKQYVVPILWTIGGVALLVPAVVGPVVKGEPLNYPFLTIAIVFFIFAVVFFGASRKSPGGSGPPGA